MPGTLELSNITYKFLHLFCSGRATSTYLIQGTDNKKDFNPKLANQQQSSPTITHNGLLDLYPELLLYIMGYLNETSKKTFAEVARYPRALYQLHLQLNGNLPLNRLVAEQETDLLKILKDLQKLTPILAFYYPIYKADFEKLLSYVRNALANIMQNNPHNLQSNAYMLALLGIKSTLSRISTREFGNTRLSVARQANLSKFLKIAETVHSWINLELSKVEPLPPALSTSWITAKI